MLNRGMEAIKLSTTFIYNFDFLFQSILEEIISGKNIGGLNVFFQELKSLPNNDGEKYRRLLERADAVEFNYYLANAVTDILFNETPAITV
jgi:hypothetical protein